MPISAGLSEGDQQWFRNWDVHLLRDPSIVPSLRAEAGLSRPFVEPSLVDDPATYGTFLTRLYGCGMLKFEPSVSKTGNLGIFFVKKKDDRLLGDIQNCFYAIGVPDGLS
eukprot:3493637-Karenia_brevis.AAC.1